MIFKNQEFKNSRIQEFKNLGVNSLDQTGTPICQMDQIHQTPYRGVGPPAGPTTLAQDALREILWDRRGRRAVGRATSRHGMVRGLLPGGARRES